MRKYKTKREKKPGERLSFYIALSICIMAVGMAIWSAYMTFTGPSDEKEGGYFSSLSTDEAAVNEEMTGVYVRETSAPKVPATVLATKPAPTSPKETKPETGNGLVLSETLPDQREKAVIGGEPTPLQAVLQVSESLSYPVKSHKVIKPYSETAVYNKTMKDYRPHTGCDFAAEKDEEVYAMCAGTVKDISVSELYGVMLEVDCGDFSVYYCGMSNDFAVSEGDRVKTGDIVGTVSQIPCESADESHVHIEVRVGDRLIDPLSVIDSES